MKFTLLKRIDELLDSQREGHHIPPGIEGEGEECTCLCCGTVFHGNYCPVCGQSRRTRRMVMSDILGNTLASLTNLDGRLVHTLRDLFTRPGYMIADYLKGCRAEYFQPVQMLFFLATIYVLLKMVLKLESDAIVISGIEDEMATDPSAEAQIVLQWVKKAVEWFQSNKALSVLLSNLLLLFPLKRTFRKTEQGRDMNLTEYFFAMAFIGCQQLIIAMVVSPVEKLLGIDLSTLLTIISMLMYLWFYRQFFQITWWRSIKSGILVLLLTGIEFFTLILMGGITMGVIEELSKS